MLRLIDSEEKGLWDGVVQSFPGWDVYYLCGYASALEAHDKSRAFLVDFSFGSERLCYPVMEKDIADSPEFQGLLPANTWFDWETPYGYGGPLSEKPLSEGAQQAFLAELTAVCKKRRVVTQFLRFHPLLENQAVLGDAVQHETLKNTIFMDLSDEEGIFQQMDSKNRNMVRKAKKNGVTIFSDHGEYLADFLDIYRQTMDRAHAEAYYYFNQEYYDTLRGALDPNVRFFYAVLEGQIIAASIFLYNERYMHYHLSGGRTAFRRFAPTNLLLYEAARWGARHGIKYLHLGGGVASRDSLFAFKKQFNRHGEIPFYIGRTILNHTAYEELLQIRQGADPRFHPNCSFYIQYREPRRKPMGAYIIAEAGDNHNGSFGLALKLVDAAKAAGVDCVKFQTFVTEEVISRYAQKAEYQKAATGTGESQFEMVKKLELSFEQFQQIKTYCDKKEIRFLSTPFDVPSVQFLDTLDMPFWKIPSGEVANLPYLLAIASTKKPVVMSTGMCEMEEIQAAIDVLKANGTPRITLLHCNTEYPTPYEDVNLRAMETMRSRFGVDVGYSDHTLGIEVPIAAVAMGATIIEKHFTLDRNMEGPDHKASLEPDELAAMVAGIRRAEQALGSGEKTASPSEKKNREIARKSIVARRAIQKGELLTEENLAVKRPGGGISPMRWFEILGTSALRNFKEDELIEL